MAFWEIAQALFQPIWRFFTDIQIPGLGISVFFAMVAIILINVVINVVLIILGVSSSYDDPVSALSFDAVQNSRPEYSERSRKPDYAAMSARYKARKFLKGRKK